MYLGWALTGGAERVRDLGRRLVDVRPVSWSCTGAVGGDPDAPDGVTASHDTSGATAGRVQAAATRSCTRSAIWCSIDSCGLSMPQNACWE